MHYRVEVTTTRDYRVDVNELKEAYPNEWREFIEDFDGGREPEEEWVMEVLGEMGGDLPEFTLMGETEDVYAHREGE